MIIGNKDNTKFKVMSILRTKLVNDPVIKAIIGDRLFPVICPEDIPAGAFIVYSRDSYSIKSTKQGIYEHDCIVFLTCVSSDYDEANDLAEAVYKSLQGFYNYSDPSTGVVINSIELYDSTEDYSNDKFIVTLALEIK